MHTLLRSTRAGGARECSRDDKDLGVRPTTSSVKPKPARCSPPPPTSDSAFRPLVDLNKILYNAVFHAPDRDALLALCAYQQRLCPSPPTLRMWPRL